MNTSYTVERANLRNAKVLVVEDNDDQWFLIEQAMHQCLGEVTSHRVASIEQAITLLEDWQCQDWELPKLLLLDLYLPQNTDGWQLLKQIKTMTATIRRIPIVMFSASPAIDDILESYQHGVSAYMVKPITYADWLACFQQMRSYWWETVTLPPVRYGF